METETVQTLEFESGRSLQSLFADEPRLLRQAEAELDVHLTVRDGWLRIEGTEEGVAEAAKVFEELKAAKTHGLHIARSDFLYALNSVHQAKIGIASLSETKIHRSSGQPPIVARTHNQKAYVDAIHKQDIVFGIGPAGTGKTYLATALAVEALKKQKVRRIILTRPAVEAGEALGFLPGDLNEKIFPYLRPLYDSLHDMLAEGEVQSYLEKGVVEVAPLAYMRGRTLNHAFIILDEAQNTTTEQMFMFLTRLGADSQCVVTGDTTQIDLPAAKQSGLIEALAALRTIPDIGFTFFNENDIVRHELVQSIIRAYKKHRLAEPDTEQIPRTASEVQ